MQIDHLVYASPTLEQGMAEIQELTAVKPVIGGKHLQWGTWNALISLGPQCFFEIIAIDPAQSYVGPIIFDLDTITESKLVRWVAKSNRIPEQVKLAEAAGFSLGPVIEGQREKQDGTLLKWSLTDPLSNPGDGLIPFLIDWRDTPHPGSATPKGCMLLALSGKHPNPGIIQQMLQAIELDFEIEKGKTIELTATIQAPNGLIKIS
jgi:hypothetical protein